MIDLFQYFRAIGPLKFIGVLGFLVYMFSCGWVQFGWLNGNGPLYSISIVVAAYLVAVGLVAEFNLSAAPVQDAT